MQITHNWPVLTRFYIENWLFHICYVLYLKNYLERYNRIKDITDSLVFSYLQLSRRPREQSRPRALNAHRTPVVWRPRSDPMVCICIADPKLRLDSAPKSCFLACVGSWRLYWEARKIESKIYFNNYYTFALSVQNCLTEIIGTYRNKMALTLLHSCRLENEMV